MSRADLVPAPLLVLGGVVSVQFGGALAATLVPEIGAGASVLVRLLFAAGIMLLIARPRLRGHTREAWSTVLLFGLALGGMNWSFYASLAHLPIGVAVTLEFIGPLLLAAWGSRRPRDIAAVIAAAGGVVLVSEITQTPLSELSLEGIGLALLAGAFWASYIVFSARTGSAFEKLDGLTLAMIVAVAVVLPAGLAGWENVSTEHLAKGLGIAVLSSVLPYSLELMALRRLSATVFGILLSLEPAVAALAGLIVLGQVLSGVQLLGMSFVVVASVLVLGFARRPDDAPGDLTETGG
ncbi:EamA family transporter [Janibacter sp. YIM B02568]|uniref:EamA family transporter n=1 Tax=Janibacter endophyticus TaxID=2806261 RepID=UPI00194F7B54|nr:EamA family transporter [Janibacter endophyticus]MBM6546479.1 EamA family transporter [Janibacter endophyticus]